jgi:hypothetical protein
MVPPSLPVVNPVSTLTATLKEHREEWQYRLRQRFPTLMQDYQTRQGVIWRALNCLQDGKLLQEVEDAVLQVFSEMASQNDSLRSENLSLLEALWSAHQQHTEELKRHSERLQQLEIQNQKLTKLLEQHQDLLRWQYNLARREESERSAAISRGGEEEEVDDDSLAGSRSPGGEAPAHLRVDKKLNPEKEEPDC